MKYGVYVRRHSLSAITHTPHTDDGRSVSLSAAPAYRSVPTQEATPCYTTGFVVGVEHDLSAGLHLPMLGLSKDEYVSLQRRITWLMLIKRKAGCLEGLRKTQQTSVTMAGLCTRQLAQ